MTALEDKNAAHQIQNLIRLCKKNDKAAQIKLYELFSKSLYNTSFRIVKDSMLAEDIVQESFLAAFQSIGNFREEASFASWIRKIVVNRSLDQLRKKHTFFESLTEDEEGKYDEAVHWNEDDQSEERERIIAELKKHILSLPDGYRIIISLYFFEGFDHEEISQILNISPSTSRSQLTRAKARLLKMLNKSRRVK